MDIGAIVRPHPIREFDGENLVLGWPHLTVAVATKIVSVNGVNHLQLSPETIGNRVGTRSALVVSTLSQEVIQTLGSDLYLNGEI